MVPLLRFQLKPMKKNSWIPLVLLFAFNLSVNAQEKKWTLEECVTYALDHNISIKQTALDTETATIDKKGAIGNFLPSFNANASHSWNIGLNQDITTGLLQNQTTQFTSVGSTVGVDIYRGLQNQNTLRKASLSIVAAKYQLVKMQEDVALNVANAFLQVLFNKENLKVQKDQLAINEKQLSRSQELVQAGSIPSGDLLDAKATVAGDNQRLIAADNALLISKLSLSQLLQLKDFENFDVEDGTEMRDENNILAQTPVSIYDVAKGNRTELKIAQTNLEIAEKNLAIAKGAFQPTLQGFYNFNTRISYSDIAVRDNQGAIVGVQSAPPFFDQFSSNKGQSFGMQLSVPIFNGFSARNNVERSKVGLEKSKIALEQQDLDLERNVYLAFTDAKGALKAHESSLVALESRQAAFDYAKEKYDVGLMNS
ncbi:MAG: outer membrane protein, partial [Flavobacterium sp.]